MSFNLLVLLMLFVPLPLFVTCALLIVAAQMVRTGDMERRTDLLFVGVIVIYAVQAGLLSLRWGYGIDAVAGPIAWLAPLAPVCAYLAYTGLFEPLAPKHMWHLGPVILIWLLWLVAFDAVDPALMALYAGYGIALIKRGAAGADTMHLGTISGVADAQRAMIITGAALIGAACVDMFVIVDFIRTGGQNVGLVISIVQAGVLLCIGLAAVTGQSGAGPTTDPATGPAPDTATPTEDDAALMARLDALFTELDLHRDTDLNLRRLARKLGVPDRAVSQAINRTQNESVSQYVNRFRIQTACDMLRTTDRAVLQVSLAAGFLSKSNFNREFVRITGQTPSAWRKSA